MARARARPPSSPRRSGSTDDDLIEMYRVDRARPRRRRADVDPQPRRPDPVRHHRPGPRGRPGRRSPGRSSRGHDWMVPFYRSIATCLTFGMSAARHHARAVREGRSTRRPAAARCPATTAPSTHNIVSLSSPVATQILHAVGHRARRQDPQDRPGRDHAHGRGQLEPGRRPRGPELRGDPQAAVILVVENNGYAICVPSSASSPSTDVAIARRGLRHPGRDRRRRRRAGVLRRGPEAVDRARRGRRPDADRGQGDPPHRPLLRRPADEVPLRGGADAELTATIRCRGSATQLRGRRRPRRRDRGADRAPRSSRHIDEAHGLRRGRSPTRPPDTAMYWVYAEDRPHARVRAQARAARARWPSGRSSRRSARRSPRRCGATRP